MAVLAGFGVFGAVEGLVIPADAERTARDLAESEVVFRLGVLSLLGVVALDVLVAWALYRVFAPVSKGTSLLAGWLRVVYAGVFLVAITELVGALRLLGDADDFGDDELHTEALSGVYAFNGVARGAPPLRTPPPGHGVPGPPVWVRAEAPRLAR